MLLIFKKDDIRTPKDVLMLMLTDSPTLNECQMLDLANPTRVAEEIFESHRNLDRHIDKTFVVAHFLNFLYACALEEYKISERNSPPAWWGEWLVKPFNVVNPPPHEVNELFTNVLVLIQNDELTSPRQAAKKLIDHYFGVLGKQRFMQIFRDCFTESRETYSPIFMVALEQYRFASVGIR